MEPSHRAGFSLVELLIVVVIIAIVSAVVIPQYLRTGDTSRYTSTIHDLQELRDTIQLYRNQHQGRLPGVAGKFPDTDFAQQLTLPTNVAGEWGGFGDTRFPLGPYIPSRLPANPFNHSNDVQTVTVFPAAAPGGVNPSDPGWIYEITSGRIRVNWLGTTPDGQSYWEL